MKLKSLILAIHATRKGRIIAASFVAAIAVTSLGVAKAHAYFANEIGIGQRAEVWCNDATNEITIYPKVGAGTYYEFKGQWLSAQYWIVDVETGEKFWPAGAVGWRNFSHKPFNGSSSTWYADNAPGWVGTVLANNDAYYKGNHRYNVYTQYAWYTSTGWVTSNALKTTSYKMYFGGGTPDCLL